MNRLHRANSSVIPRKTNHTVTKAPWASITFASGDSFGSIDGAKIAIFPFLTPISYLPRSAAVATRPFLIMRSNDIFSIPVEKFPRRGCSQKKPQLERGKSGLLKENVSDGSPDMRACKGNDWQAGFVISISSASVIQPSSGEISFGRVAATPWRDRKYKLFLERPGAGLTEAWFRPS